jgi:cell shape-determining protein MreD
MNTASAASRAMTMLAAPFRRGTLRFVGFLLACLFVVLPALPWFSQPPLPIAALWCAYGWAAEGEEHGSWKAPVALALLGLAQDQMSGGPLGFYALIFVITYLIGKVAARTMRSANLISPWTGFLATAVGSCVAAAGVSALLLGDALSATRPYVVAALITGALFPLVRPLYLGEGR